MIRLLYAVLLGFLIWTGSATAQDRCGNRLDTIFVWDFLTTQKNVTPFTVQLTEKFETFLVGTEKCVVLQRRQFATSTAFWMNEKATTSGELTNTARRALEKANQVAYGTFDTATSTFRVTIECLETSRIVDKKEIVVTATNVDSACETLAEMMVLDTVRFHGRLVVDGKGRITDTKIFVDGKMLGSPDSNGFFDFHLDARGSRSDSFEVSFELSHYRENEIRFRKSNDVTVAKRKLRPLTSTIRGYAFAGKNKRVSIVINDLTGQTMHTESDGSYHVDILESDLKDDRTIRLKMLCGGFEDYVLPVVVPRKDTVNVDSVFLKKRSRLLRGAVRTGFAIGPVLGGSTGDDFGHKYYGFTFSYLHYSNILSNRLFYGLTGDVKWIETTNTYETLTNYVGETNNSYRLFAVGPEAGISYHPYNYQGLNMTIRSDLCLQLQVPIENERSHSGQFVEKRKTFHALRFRAGLGCRYLLGGATAIELSVLGVLQTIRSQSFVFNIFGNAEPITVNPKGNVGLCADLRLFLSK